MEKSWLWTTNGTGDGTGTGYTQTDASNIFEITSQCFGRNGAAANYLNVLAPSTTGVNNARIATGGALVDGKPYKNDANVDVVIASAVGGGNTRIDRVVLRCSWAAQTVRITRIAGTDAASPTAPAITQTSGTTYDIKICQALVNTAGTVTITDERDIAQVDTSEIANSAVTTAKILDANVTLAKLATDSVDASKIAAGAVGSSELATGAVTAGKIAAGGVSATSQLADDIVDDTKVGNRVPQFYRRQGGSSADWSTPGTTTYTPSAVRMQSGTLTTDDSGFGTVTFPQPFWNNPVSLVSPFDLADKYIVMIQGIYNTTLYVRTFALDGSPMPSKKFIWLAFGTE